MFIGRNENYVETKTLYFISVIGICIPSLS